MERRRQPERAPRAAPAPAPPRRATSGGPGEPVEPSEQAGCPRAPSPRGAPRPAPSRRFVSRAGARLLGADPGPGERAARELSGARC